MGSKKQTLEQLIQSLITIVFPKNKIEKIVDCKAGLCSQTVSMKHLLNT